MKRETKKTVSETIIYVCEKCGAKSSSVSIITSCEKSHTCEHKIVYEFIDGSDDDAWWFNIKGIESRCKLCYKNLGEIDFEQVDDEQELLKSIYEMVNKCIEDR